MYKIYNIKYLEPIQYGGDIITYDPEYPVNLEKARLTEWPPKINEKINVKDPNSKKDLTGFIIENIWNDTASIIKLNDPNYIEMSLKDDPKYNYGRGFFLLLPDYYWEPIVNKIDKKTNIETVNTFSINNKIDTIIHENIKPSTSPKNNNPIEKKKLLTKTDTKVIHSKPLASPNNNIITPKNILNPTSETKDIALDVLDFKVKEEKSKIVTSTLEPNIPNNQELITNNTLYKPLLARPKKDYFSDIKLDIKISNQKNKFISLDTSKKKLLIDKLKQFQNIESKEIFIVVNQNIAISNLIQDPNDEINEGEKIIKWINETLKKKIFTDLITKIHEGYVYITRNGVKVLDTISKDLVDIKHFDWQQGKPINYDTLKYVIFQNEFQVNIEDNIEQKREAEDILSQEYVLALQPTPLYQLWTLKRLIMIWYSDPIIEKNIRKIKVLINQFRCDPTKEYNKKNGILGSILIYPKYGIKSTKEIISKMEYYFSLYIDENSNSRFQNIQWENSNPSYFIKKNSLMYYTNGTIELKNYIRDSIANSNLNNTNIQNKENNIYTRDYTEFLESDRLMGV